MSFFYEECLLIGSENFKDHHKLFLNTKICPTVYENIAWNSQHPQKDLVLIFAIETKLNENSNYLKEKHVDDSGSIPKWFNQNTKWYLDEIISEKEFVNSIEYLIKTS